MNEGWDVIRSRGRSCDQDPHISTSFTQILEPIPWLFFFFQKTHQRFRKKSKSINYIQIQFPDILHGHLIHLKVTYSGKIWAKRLVSLISDECITIKQGVGQPCLFCWMCNHIEVSISVLVFPFFSFLKDNTLRYRRDKSIRSPLKILLTVNTRILKQENYLKRNWQNSVKYHKRTTSTTTETFVHPQVHPSVHPSSHPLFISNPFIQKAFIWCLLGAWHCACH